MSSIEKHPCVNFICRDIDIAFLYGHCLKVLGKYSNPNFSQQLFYLDDELYIVQFEISPFMPAIRVCINDTNKFNVIDVAELVCNTCPDRIVEVEIYLR